MHYHHSLRVISRWTLCSCSHSQLTTREMQYVPGSCRGATQCQLRALRLRSVCFFVSLCVVPFAVWAHSVPLCGLISPFLKSQAPLLSGSGFRWLPLLWHWTVGWKNMNVSVSFCSFVKQLLLIDREDDDTARERYNTLKNTHGSVCWNQTICCWESAMPPWGVSHSL